MRRSVTVSGIGVVSAFGTSNEFFRDALLDGRSGIAPLTGFDTTGCRSVLAGEVTDFDPTSWVAPMKLRRLDRTGAYAVSAMKLALQDAEMSIAADGDDRVGVVLGTWTAGGQSTQIFLDAFFRKGPAAAPALLFDSTVANSAASLAGLELKLRGPNITVSHKEASGLAAIVTAVDLLRERRATALFAGGVDAVYETFYKGHDRFRVMSSANTFSSRLSPFDASRDGFVMGEGGFGMWLHGDAADEGEVAGRTRGAILGVAASSAAVAVNAWPTRPEALARTMAQAIDDAGMSARDIDVVYASANASSDLDLVEALGLRQVFADARPLVTSIKGALGEFGAAGSASLAAALLCGGNGMVPPIAGLHEPDPVAAPLWLARTAMQAPGPIALINSFASGGALFSIVVRAGA